MRRFLPPFGACSWKWIMRIQKTEVIAILALICCALWGSAFPCIKIGYEWFSIENTGSQMLFAGYRFFLAGVMTFLLFSLKSGKPLTMKKTSIPMVFGQGVLQTTIQYFFFYLGLSNTTGAKGSVITASNAFFSILIAHFIFKGEKMDWRKALGCIVGFAGVIIVNLTPGAWGSGFAWNGEGFILLCAAAYGASSVTTKLIAKYEKPETITAYQLMIGGAILIIMGYLTGGTMGDFTVKSAVLFFYLAFLSTISFTLWAMLLKYNPISKVAPYGFTIPIFGTVLSGLFLHEDIFTWNNLLALALVSGGIIWVNTEAPEAKKAD